MITLAFGALVMIVAALAARPFTRIVTGALCWAKSETIESAVNTEPPGELTDISIAAVGGIARNSERNSFSLNPSPHALLPPTMPKRST